MTAVEESTVVSMLVTLEAVLNQLKSEECCIEHVADFSLADFWTQFGASMQNVSTQTTKLALAFSQPPYPSSDVSKPLVAATEMSALVLNSVYHSLPKSKGKTLHKAVVKAVTDVLEALQSLVKSLISREDSNLSNHLHVQSTGTVWKFCDESINLPRDNTRAVLVAMNETEELISDAANELEEALKNECVDEVTDWVDDLAIVMRDQHDDIDVADTEHAMWSEADRAFILACLGLIKTAKAAVKKMLKVVATSGRCDTPEAIQELDVFVEHVNAVSPAIDDLATSLYPPLKLHAARMGSEKVAVILRQLIDMARCSHFTADADSTWLDFLQKAVDHNLAKVNDTADTSSSV